MKTFKFLELASVENSVAGPHFLCPLNLKTHLTVPWGPYASKPHHLQGLPPFSAGHLLCPSLELESLCLICFSMVSCLLVSQQQP